jgi:hypothetical protein
VESPKNRTISRGLSMEMERPNKKKTEQIQ